MGALISQISQLMPPKPKFAVGDVPELSGKVIFVTGANTGVGYEIAEVRIPFASFMSIIKCFV
jgi:hypothetical protein